MLSEPSLALTDIARVSLRDLAMVLSVAAVTTVVFQRLRQPVVLGYLLAGILVGPHTPGAGVRDIDTLHALSELGVVLVFFSIGLEFSVRRLVAIGPRPAFVALFEVGATFWLGFLCGGVLGLEWRASLFVGAIVSISSTVLIQRVFGEGAVEKPIQETVLSILIYEDIVGILMLSVLSALAVGEELDLGVVAQTGGKLLAFLSIAIVAGFLIVPRAVRFVLSLRRRETLLVACLGLCFALALVAGNAGFSTALGAFLAGSLVAESGHGHEIHRRVQPVVDVFSAIFFVSIGMQVDPQLIVDHWFAIALLSVVTIVGKIVFASLGTFLVGEDRQTALRAGISLAQIGELAFIVAGLGVATRTTPPWIAAVAVCVSTITAFVTPYLIRNSRPIAASIDRWLPERLQTLATLYGAWLSDIKERGHRDGPWRTVMRPLRVLFLDSLVLVAFVIAGTLLAEGLARWVGSAVGVGASVAFAIVVAGVSALCVPLFVGIVNASRRLGLALAVRALPAAESGHADMAQAPRRALVVSLQLSVILCITLLVLALTEPFLPRFASPALLGLVVIVLVSILWRTAADLHGHVRAGAEVIGEALSHSRPQALPRELSEVTRVLPGFGDLTMLTVPDDSRIAGRTLAELDLRGRSGASVIAIQRGDRRIAMPRGGEEIHGGDLLALAGSPEDVDTAIGLLGSDPEA
jgi:CPA2 family monovalent cation:H+ antiporter-2